jgi:hypothetical protein
MLLKEQRESAVAPERHPRCNFPRCGQTPPSEPDREDTKSRDLFGATVIDLLWM